MLSHMQLKEYFLKERIDPYEFAYVHKISVNSIYRYLKGGKCHPKRAYLLEKLTGGKVTAEELLKINEKS